MAKERLDKILGHMGLGSRREVKELIRQGRVSADGVLAGDPGLQVDPVAQELLVDGAPLGFAAHFYLMLHKPAGLITAARDPRSATVMDLIPDGARRRDLHPVGRLDKETEGLLLFTTDGELTHRLLSPRWHVDKRYLAQVDARLDASDVQAFAQGLLLDDGYRCLPALLQIEESSLTGMVTVQEGKYHQVRRMFQACGKRVLYLKRLSMGPLQLGALPLGQVRPLTDPELKLLYAAVGLVRP